VSEGGVKLAFDLLFSKQGDNLIEIHGDGVPRTTARAGLMTPTAQADAAVGSIRCERYPLQSGFFCACAMARMVF